LFFVILITNLNFPCFISLVLYVLSLFIIHSVIPNLQELYLSKNDLIAIPSELGEVTELKNLNLDYKNIIKIINPKSEFTKFDLTYEYKKELIELGYKTTEEYLEQII